MPRCSLLLAVAALLDLTLVAVDVASDDDKTRSSKPAEVAARVARTVAVDYPDAMKFGGSNYKCSAKVVSGDKDSVTIRKGSAQGGSVCRARIRNDGSRSVKVKVTATTIEPEQQRGWRAAPPIRTGAARVTLRHATAQPPGTVSGEG